MIDALSVDRIAAALERMAAAAERQGAVLDEQWAHHREQMARSEEAMAGLRAQAALADQVREADPRRPIEDITREFLERLEPILPPKPDEP